MLRLLFALYIIELIGFPVSVYLWAPFDPIIAKPEALSTPLLLINSICTQEKLIGLLDIQINQDVDRNAKVALM
jgi:hypothetical protein